MRLIIDTLNTVVKVVKNCQFNNIWKRLSHIWVIMTTISLTMKVNFMSFNFMSINLMHSKSNNVEIEIMIGNETDGIIDELFA